MLVDLVTIVQTIIIGVRILRISTEILLLIIIQAILVGVLQHSCQIDNQDATGSCLPSIHSLLIVFRNRTFRIDDLKLWSTRD